MSPPKQKLKIGDEVKLKRGSVSAKIVKIEGEWIILDKKLRTLRGDYWTFKKEELKKVKK